jgi:hypothetical protein
MNKFDSRRAIHKTILIVAASLALATVTVTTGTSALARGGGGGGFGGHFGGGFRDHFGAGRFAGRHFGRRFGDGFGLYGFGDVAPYYGGYGGRHHCCSYSASSPAGCKRDRLQLTLRPVVGMTRRSLFPPQRAEPDQSLSQLASE